MGRSVRINYITDILNVDLSLQGSTLSSLISGTPNIITGALSHPNEPPGAVRFYENAYTVAPDIGLFNDNGAAIDGTWWATTSNFNIKTDITAPSGEDLVLSVDMPIGLNTGTGPGILQEWDTVAENHNTEYSELYCHWRFKLDPGSDGLYEQHPVLTKIMGFWGSGRNNFGTNASDWHIDIETNFDESNPTTHGFLQDGFKLFHVQSFYGNPPRFLNRNISYRMFVDTWYDYEIHCIIDSSPGAGDGVFKMWVDGMIIFDYSNIQWNSVAESSGFYGRHNSPTWGGLGTGPRDTLDHFLYDDLYMSGIV